MGVGSRRWTSFRYSNKNLPRMALVNHLSQGEIEPLTWTNAGCEVEGAVSFIAPEISSVYTASGTRAQST